MAQTFEDLTREVVHRFLQNILFVDDNAYQNDKEENAFDASEISSVFAQRGILCTVYAPHHENDIVNCKPLFAKADVAVIDWYLKLDKEQQEMDGEADAETEEPRGVYTIKLINNIIEDASDKKLKLVVIYTGETDLTGITEELFKETAQYGNFQQGDCCVFSSNIMILVRAKYKEESQFKHNEELRSKIVKYEDLPDFITVEFSKMVNGIMPIFALTAIFNIREQTSKILRIYSNEIDYAYLGHRVLLENQRDAYHMLQKVFGESMSDLIVYSNSKMDDWISLWIDNRFPEPKTTTIGSKPITVDKNVLKELLSNSAESYKDKISRLFKGDLTNKEAMGNSTCLFSTNEEVATSSNVKFAILTHHKNVFGVQSGRPFLTLGTVVSHDEEYYVCIQQRCDSVRLKAERRFLFLPLTNKDSNIHVLINNNHRLNVSDLTYALKTIIFIPHEGEDCIFAKEVGDELENKKYVFESKYGEEYEWVLELKDLQAQRIVDAYCSKLSRVGLDESEWLRLL